MFMTSVNFTKRSIFITKRNENSAYLIGQISFLLNKVVEKKIRFFLTGVTIHET